MVGLEFKGRDSTGGLDGIAVKLDRVTEEEAEEAIDTLEPERPFKVDKSSSSQSSPSSPFAESHPKAAPDAIELATLIDDAPKTGRLEAAAANALGFLAVANVSAGN